ncbi:ABC transporter substrate-binding protein [Dissulfuribacter thermophilus]|uniref:ABC transporter substrate-binding protein n=1 Tax=Dissulfuribacter thermophilus TaxID=1156395 RepID=A0A1B9F748_9BACT|nr:ABC transporter substrate binding protein [Dissulfuribacter thermophilus]OCC15674.1 ABC transporter substrate-binding protein [Dissulfuribacter thermophilus]
MKEAISIFFFIFWAIMAFFFYKIPVCLGTQGPTITVIVSSEIRPYKEALGGLKSSLTFPIQEYNYRSNPKLVEHVLKSESSDFVVAIGPEAAKAARASSPLPPHKKLYLMVLDPKSLLKQQKICGVDLRIPVERQLDAISKRFPPPVRIGILYNALENQKIIDEFVKKAEWFNATVTGIQVNTPKDCPGALIKNRKNIDILLFIPDTIVIKEALVQYLIKESIFRGIAVVGYNHFFIENGAVMSLSIDYEEVGKLGANLLKQIWDGGKCSLLPPPFKLEWNQRAWDTVRQRR